MDGKKKLEELVAGLDGVTPGPWRPSRFGFQIVSDFPEAAWQGVVELRTKACSFPHAENEMKSQEAIANHLARCDPDTIRSISDAFKAMEEERDALRAILGEYVHASAVEERVNPGTKNIAFALLGSNDRLRQETIKVTLNGGLRHEG